MHQFKVGQLVEVVRSRLTSAAGGTYEIRRLVPVSATDPQYRLKGANEKFERIVAEGNLRLLAQETNIFS